MFTLNCKGKPWSTNRPVVMGIINTTPDSFYEQSRHAVVSDALYTAEKMIAEGAAMLDIGGQSTRPGSNQIGAEEEIQRVIPVIDAISKTFSDVLISVDTYHASVVRNAADHGASIVNDISGGRFDTAMLSTVAELHMPYICMHSKGTEDTMHSDPEYTDVTREVMDYFINKISECTEAGINDLIIDPGFGFSKTIAHNFELLKNLEVFSLPGKPVLLGVSRKSTIYKTLGITADEALNGSTVLHTAGLLKGVSILRVHDVKEAVEAIKLISYLQ